MLDHETEIASSTALSASEQLQARVRPISFGGDGPEKRSPDPV